MPSPAIAMPHRARSHSLAYFRFRDQRSCVEVGRDCRVGGLRDFVAYCARESTCLFPLCIGPGTNGPWANITSEQEHHAGLTQVFLQLQEPDSDPDDLQ